MGLGRFVWILAGLAALGTGLISTCLRVGRAARTHHSSHRMYATMPEGWGSWFFHGVSKATTGAHLVMTLALFLGWMLLGVACLLVGSR